MIYGGIRDRVTGKHPYKGRKYIGLPLEFTRPEFVGWVTNNPPPLNMEQPSVDRIEESLGYTLTNIQWMPTRQNARKHFKHLGLKTTMNPNPLPELDEEYPVDLSESICINCDDLRFLHVKGHWKPCPKCNPQGTPELPKDEPTV